MRDRFDDDEHIQSELEKSLRIDKANLDDEVVNQPDLYYRVSRKLAELISKRDSAKQDVQEAEAEAEKDLRKSAADEGDKITEAQVKAEVRLDKKVQAARSTLAFLEASVGRWEALKESYKQRSYAIGNLVDLYQDDYFGSATPGGSGGREASDRRAERNKEEMAKQREQRSNRR